MARTMLAVRARESAARLPNTMGQSGNKARRVTVHIDGTKSSRAISPRLRCNDTLNNEHTVANNRQPQRQNQTVRPKVCRGYPCRHCHNCQHFWSRRNAR